MGTMALAGKGELETRSQPGEAGSEARRHSWVRKADGSRHEGTGTTMCEPGVTQGRAESLPRHL